MTLLVLAAAFASTASSPAAPAAAGPPTYFAQSGLAQLKVVRPHRLVLSVDGSLFVRRMTWTRWDASAARGRGTSAVNLCRPNCAEGHIRQDPVRVTLSHPVRRCGHRFFTRVVLRYPDGHPRFFPATLRLPRFRPYCG